jgi:hypothetical protein
MRPLTEDENKAVFEKLTNYIVRALTCLRNAERNDIFRRGKIWCI